MKKIFEKFFIGSKEPPSNFRGTFGGSFDCLTSSFSRKARKHPLVFLKAKKDATVKLIPFINASYRTLENLLTHSSLTASVYDDCTV